MSAPRSIVVLLLLLILPGCGVDWFPKFERKPTTPDTFSFATKTGVSENSTVESDPVTVAGLTADAPISVSGSVGSNSTYSINGGTPTADAGTVKNGDVVRVQHTSAGALGTDTISTLIIGDVSATFTSTTLTILLPTFADRTGSTAAPAGSVVEVSGVLLASDLVPHEISITNGVYSLDNVNNFTSATQTISFLNGRTIFLHTTASTVSGQSVAVTLTIDNVKTTWTVTTR